MTPPNLPRGAWSGYHVSVQVSILSSLSETGGRSPVDATVDNLAGLRDEGFRRVWMTQMPYEPDLLTVLAVALP